MSERIRVVQLVTTWSGGGAQRTVLGTSVDLPPDIDVDVWTGPDDPGEGDLWREAAEAGVRVHVVPHLHRAIRPVRDLRALIWLVRELRRQRPDVVHTHSTKAGVLGRVAAWLAGVPVVHTVHGWSFAPLEGILRRTVILLEVLLARVTTRLVVVTTADEELGLSVRIGVPGRYAIVRSGIDVRGIELAQSDRCRAREELGLASSGPVIGTVARLAPQKNLGVLLRAGTLLDLGARGAQIVVIGDGPDRARLEDLTKKLGIASFVRFVGARADGSRLLCGLDVFVLTSRWEGLPRTILEAMAARVPVVATPVGGVSEVLDDGVSGLLVDVDDELATAAAIARFLDHPDERRAIVENAGRRVAAFDEVRMRDDVASVWRGSTRVP